MMLLLRCHYFHFTIPSVSIHVLHFLYPFLFVLFFVLLLVLIFPPPSFIVVVLHIKTNNCDHPTRPFDHIYQAVSLMRRPGSFSLSYFSPTPPRFNLVHVHVLLFPPPSPVSIDPSLYRVVPDLFLSFYMSFFVRLYLSIGLFIISYRIFSSLFKFHCDLVRVRVLLRWTVSIHPSLHRVAPDLFVSLYILFLFLFCSSSSYSTST